MIYLQRCQESSGHKFTLNVKFPFPLLFPYFLYFFKRIFVTNDFPAISTFPHLLTPHLNHHLSQLLACSHAHESPSRYRGASLIFAHGCYSFMVGIRCLSSALSLSTFGFSFDGSLHRSLHSDASVKIAPSSSTIFIKISLKLRMSWAIL